jgi:prolipoprotein diacylglyceryltransferase
MCEMTEVDKHFSKLFELIWNIVVFIMVILLLLTIMDITVT